MSNNITTQQFKDALTQSGEKIPADIDNILSKVDLNANGQIEQTEAELFIKEVEAMKWFRPDLIHVSNGLKSVVLRERSIPRHSLELSVRNYRFESISDRDEEIGPFDPVDGGGTDLTFLYRTGQESHVEKGGLAFVSLGMGPGVFVSRFAPDMLVADDASGSGSLATFGPLVGGGIEFGFNPLGRLGIPVYFTAGGDVSARLGFIVQNDIDIGDAEDHIVEVEAVGTAYTGVKVPVSFWNGYTIALAVGLELARGNASTMDWLEASVFEPRSFYAQAVFQVE